MGRLNTVKRRGRLYSAAALCLFLFSCCGIAAGEAPAGSAVGEKAYNFELMDLNGKTLSLKDFAGKENVLLVCTTTWCPHCVTIIPELKKIHNSYFEKGLKVIAVYVNEREGRVSRFSKKYGLPYTVLLDTDGAVASRYNIRGVPTLMLIGLNGVIEYRGYSIPSGMIEELLGK